MTKAKSLYLLLFMGIFSLFKQSKMDEKETKFKFTESKNKAVFTCKHVLDDKEPILYITHDSDDDWQFLCGRNDHTEEDGKIISLKNAVDIDTTINKLFEMPIGLGAERKKLVINGFPLNFRLKHLDILRSLKTLQQLMQKKINIEHQASSFPKRYGYWFLSWLAIVAVGYIISFARSENALVPFIIFSSIIGVSILLQIKRTRMYISDFYSDSNKVMIRFLKGNIETELKTTLDKLDIKLKNTSTSLGFNCEIRLKVENKYFVIEDRFDWSFLEMVQLFEHVMHFKNEPLSEGDKFNLSKMRGKSK